VSVRAGENEEKTNEIKMIRTRTFFYDLHSVFGNMSMGKIFLNDLFHAIWERLESEDEYDDEPSNRAVSHAYNLIHNDTLKEDQLQKQLATVTRPEKGILNTLSHQYSIKFARQSLPDRSSVSYAYRTKFGTFTSRDPKSPRSEPIKKKQPRRDNTESNYDGDPPDVFSFIGPSTPSTPLLPEKDPTREEDEDTVHSFDYSSSANPSPAGSIHFTGDKRYDEASSMLAALDEEQFERLISSSNVLKSYVKSKVKEKRKPNKATGPDPETPILPPMDLEGTASAIALSRKLSAEISFNKLELRAVEL
jgi:hypothetical protein